MNFAFMGLGPFLLLVTLNALTLRSLLASDHNGHHEKKNEIALAKVSLSIVFVFILCHSVKWIPNLFELARLAWDDKREWPPWIESVTHISHFLMVLNSSVNFYIYCGKHKSVLTGCCSESPGSRNDLSLALSGGNNHTTDRSPMLLKETKSASNGNAAENGRRRTTLIESVDV